MGMLIYEVIKMKKLKKSLCPATFCAVFLINMVSGSEDPVRALKEDFFNTRLSPDK
jgi:hypothetical protein